MKSNIVFHISDGMIKFLQVSGAQKKVVTAIDVISTDQLSDIEISQRLMALVKQRHLKFKDAQVTIIIPRTRSILRYMTLPSHEDGEIRSMIDLQVVNHIPYAREEVEIDFQVLEKTADGYSKIVAVIIPIEVAMRYWKIFNDSHIPITQMTISSIGLWLLYQQQVDVPTQLGGIIDLDVNHSEICLCHKEYWLTSREIPVGLAQIQRDGYGEFSRQWELTRTNAAKEKAMESIGIVYLVSTSAQTHALSVDMGKEQDVNFKEIDLMQGLPVVKNLVWPKSVIDDGISLAALVGVAFNAQPSPVDLIPQSVRNRQAQSIRQKEWIVLGLWGLAGIIMLSLAFGMGFIKKNTQLNHVEKRLKTAKYDAAKVEQRLGQVYDLEDTFKRRLIFTDLVTEIYKLLPQQLSLISFTISDGSTLSIQGVSSRPGDINVMQKGMVESPLFTNVNLDYVNKRITQDGEVNYFKITCVIKSVKGPDEKTE